ncbi:hypothetical protein AB4059_04180 [Lysobacter sp. 2RAF19]
MPIFNSVQQCSEQAASWTSGDYIALAALGTALITGMIAYRAYIASIRQLEQNQRHNELSVRPLLDFDVDIWAPDGEGGIWLANHGYGAAVLKRIGATLDGTDYDFFDPIAQRQFPRAIPNATNFQIPCDFEYLTGETHRALGTAIPHGTRSQLMLIVKDTTNNFRASFHAAKGLKLWANYEDLYGNEFSASFDNSDYQPIPAGEILDFIEGMKSQGAGSRSMPGP